jgi:monoamine oxidase
LSGARSRQEVVIVGAGFTGLSAASELAAHDIEFVLLEARDRVGGRVESAVNALGERIDTGGQFLCRDMPALMRLASLYGKTLVHAPVDGAFVTQPSLPDERADLMYSQSGAIRERMNGIQPDDPAIAGLTVAAWLQRQDDDADAKSAFRSMVEGLWCQDADRIPLWYLIENDRRITNEVSELQYFLGETMQSLAQDMARRLGDRLVLEAPATSIEHRAAGVRVATPTGTFEAQTVLVAVPPVMASRIHYSPALPALLTRALEAWRSGTVIKVQLRYERAFWRDQGLSGMVMWRDLHGLFTCDASSDAGRPSLLVFIGGLLALRWRALGEAGLRQELIARLTAALGPEAAAFIAMTPRDWTGDSWSGGGYSDLILDQDARDAEPVLRAGNGRVQFASSELSPSFPGYVEGAIVTGQIAARKIMELPGSSAHSAIATSASGS